MFYSYRKKLIIRTLKNRIYFIAQIGFYHDKQHGFFMSVGKCYIYQINTYHRWHHCLCEERHLVGEMYDTKMAMLQGFCTYQFLKMWTWCGVPLCHLLSWWYGPHAVGFTKIGGRSVWGGGKGCWTRPHPICEATGPSQCPCWGIDHWPFCT